MKTLITSAVLAVMVASPALANKTPVKPVESQCAAQVEQLQAQILMMKKELAVLSQPSAMPKPKKPVHNEKAG